MKSKRHYILAYLMVVCLFLDFGTLYASAQTMDPMARRTAKQVLGAQNVSVLSGATRVQVFQLGKPYSPLGAAAPRIEGYTIVATGKEQGKEFAARLAVAMMDDQIYRYGGALCFSPHVAFRAWKGSSYVDVLICFHCGNLQVHSSEGGQDTAATIYSSRHPSFVDLAKEAFPGEPGIQMLDSTIYHITRKGQRSISISSPEHK